MQSVIINPIGEVISGHRYRYETPRQGILASSEEVSLIRLCKGHNFEQALKEIEGFERLWIIYQFHLNKNWRPLVMPPRHRRKKVGVFATRAPYRPNGIGLSCVKLLEVKGLDILITESDILNGSPVLDIKPYLPYSDSFPDAAAGWAKGTIEDIFEIEIASVAEEKMNWLFENAGINLKNFARLQLEFSPTDDSRKRIRKIAEGKYELAYRTWRILYSVNTELKQVKIDDVYSGYSATELMDLEMDKYDDKSVHLNFSKIKFNA